jgi:hypothetical protein
MKKKIHTGNAILDLKLWKFLDHSAFLINRTRKQEMAVYSLTPEKANVPDILHKSSGRVTIRKIADITMRRHNPISILVNRMVRQGYIDKIGLKKCLRQVRDKKYRAPVEVYRPNIISD